MSVEVDCESVGEFSADVKKCGKKYKNLESDLDVALKFLKSMPVNSGSPQISGLGNLTLPVFKLRKFRSGDVKNKGSRSGFRLIYAFSKAENKIILVELYHKNKKDDCDAARIKKYFG